MTRRGLWFGFGLGFLFGVFGIWIFAALSLIFQPVEVITAPLFWAGRFVAGFIEQNGSVGTLGTAFLFTVNGLVYGLAGMLLQLALRKKA